MEGMAGMKILDICSWLPAKEISIGGLEQIFIKHLNGTYEGEYKVLLEMIMQIRIFSVVAQSL